MTPAQARAMLDRQLAKHGQNVTLRRFTGPASARQSTWTDAPIRAHIRPATTEEIASGINAKSSKIIASPTDAGSGPVAIAMDAIVQGAAKSTITIWSPIVMAGEVVRIEGRFG